MRSGAVALVYGTRPELVKLAPLADELGDACVTVHTGQHSAEMLADVAAALAQAERPVLVLGSDVWADGAEEAARRAADAMGVPVVANGMGRGILPAGHPQLVTKARSLALGQADLVIVVGAPLDFRLGYGSFGGKQPAASSAEDRRRTPSPR